MHFGRRQWRRHKLNMTHTNYYIPQNQAYSVIPCQRSSQTAATSRASTETRIKVLPITPGLKILSDKCEDLGVESTFGELPETVITPALMADPIDRFLTRKLSIREASIKQVANEIAERIRLRNKLFEWIDQDICELKERLYLTAPWGHASPFSVGDARRRAAIERELSALETEKRREETSAWRDVASLKRELRELLSEYEEEKRKQELMHI